MGQIYKSDHYIVIIDGLLKIDFPISSTVYVRSQESGADTIELITVGNSQLTSSRFGILVSDIIAGSWENDLAVVYTEGTFLEFLRRSTGYIPQNGDGDLVTSVFARIGDVVAQNGDYNTDQVTEGETNKYNQTHTGDVTGAGVLTIGTNRVTDANLFQVPTQTIKGRTTAGTGNVENLTATQTTEILNVFTAALKGLVPLSGGGTTKFLRADGVWSPLVSAPIMRSVQMSIGTIISSGAASSGFVLDGNEIVYFINGSNPGQSKIVYLQFIIPADYTSGGTFTFSLKKTKLIPVLTATAFVDNFASVGVSASPIQPDASGVYEIKTASFLTNKIAGQTVNLRIDFTGSNGEDIKFRTIYFNYLS